MYFAIFSRVAFDDGKIVRKEKTEPISLSINAGYTMAALAGALETKFEKVNHYKLGNGEIILTKEHVNSALTMMKLTSILFFGIVTIPIITVLSLVGWWIYA